MALSPPMLSSEAVNFNISWVKLSNSLIIKLDPMIFALFNVTEIMTKVSAAVMKNNSFQLEVVFGSRIDIFLLIQGVVVNIQLHWELPSRVYFLVFKFVVVEAHSLQMNDKMIGNFCKVAAFSYVSFLLARIALIVRNHLPFNTFIERFFDIFIAFNFQRKRVERLLTLINSFAIWADCLIAGFTSENIFKNVFKRCSFKTFLHFIKEQVQKLLSILLYRHINGHSFKIFESKTKLVRIEILLFRKLKISKHDF